jgi:hypothetical protein
MIQYDLSITQGRLAISPSCDLTQKVQNEVEIKTILFKL